jgi:TPR repeat protein
LLALAPAAGAYAQASPARMCEAHAGHPWEPGQGGIGVPWGKVATAPAIAACRAALAEAPASPELMFRLARALIQDQLYDEGLPLLLAAASAGYPPAEAAYGTAFINAQGVNPDYDIAREWLQKAAAQAHPIARNNLATMLSFGLGTTPDIEAAIELYRQSAEAGYPLAMHNLALTYDRRADGDEDLVAALEWFTRSAEAGNTASAAYVGRAHELGRGVNPDDVAAARWYRIAAEAGDPGSQTQLALFYIAGRGGLAADKPLAIEWLHKAADQLHTPAMRHLGIQLLLADTSATASEEGIAWLERAGADGDIEAYTELAEYAVSSGDVSRAAELAHLILQEGDETQKIRATATLAILDPAGASAAQFASNRYLLVPTIQPGSTPVPQQVHTASQIAGR